MTGRRILLPYILLAFPVLLSAQATQNQAIALEYARQALDLLQEELSAEAYLLAGRGLGFDDASSDLHYLRAVSAAHRQSETGAVREHLERALALDSWRLIDAQDGIRSLLSLLLRTGDVTAAEELFPSLVLRRAVDHRLAAQILRLSGDFPQADAAFTRGRRLYPHDPGLFRYGLSLDRSADPEERRWIDRHASEDPDYLAALLDFILVSPSAAERRELLERYFAAGGEHPMAYAAAVEAAGGNPGSALSRFIDAEAYLDRSALQLVYRVVAGSPEAERLAASLGSVSGTVVEDANRDGFFESRMVLRDGELVGWEIDRETDGTIEWLLDFADGVPVRAEHTVAGESYRVLFFDYPEASAVTFLNLPGNPTYHLMPASTDYTVVPPASVRNTDTLELLVTLRIDDSPSILAPTRVARSSYLVDFQGEEGSQSARVLVDGTEPVRRFEDSTGNGRIDRVLDYEGGVLVAGVADPDEDGYFEVTEQYQDGELVLLLVDENDDFVVEYTEAPGSELLGTPAVYSWDLDEDGLVDMQEIVQEQDRLLGAFAGPEPGIYDVTFEAVGRVFSP